MAENETPPTPEPEPEDARAAVLLTGRTRYSGTLSNPLQRDQSGRRRGRRCNLRRLSADTRRRHSMDQRASPEPEEESERRSEPERPPERRSERRSESGGGAVSSESQRSERLVSALERRERRRLVTCLRCDSRGSRTRRSSPSLRGGVLLLRGAPHRARRRPSPRSRAVSSVLLRSSAVSRAAKGRPGSARSVP